MEVMANNTFDCCYERDGCISDSHQMKVTCFNDTFDNVLKVISVLMPL